MDDMFLDDAGFDMSIDLTPMVDVLFMLLIFFITATTFIKPVIDVNLATAESATRENTSGKQIVITINKTGEIFLDDRQVSLSELEQIFTREQETSINLFVDRKTPFQNFLSVIDLAKQHKRDDLVVTTKPVAETRN